MSNEQKIDLDLGVKDSIVREPPREPLQNSDYFEQFQMFAKSMKEDAKVELMRDEEKNFKKKFAQKIKGQAKRDFYLELEEENRKKLISLEQSLRTEIEADLRIKITEELLPKVMRELRPLVEKEVRERIVIEMMEASKIKLQEDI